MTNDFLKKSKIKGTSSLWRKSRIRLGPGAIEPVH